MWVVSSVLANVLIAYLEYTYRTTGMLAPWGVYFRIVVSIALMQLSLWYTWKNAPTFLTAWVVFFTGNMLLRIFTTVVILHEAPSFQVWAGIALAVVAAIAVKLG